MLHCVHFSVGMGIDLFLSISPILLTYKWETNMYVYTFESYAIGSLKNLVLCSMHSTVII